MMTFVGHAFSSLIL